MRYGVRRIMGAETEYGVFAPRAPQSDPTILSAMVVNTYAQLIATLNSRQAGINENPRITWDGGAETPLRDVYGTTGATVHPSQLTHTRRELTSEDIALELRYESAPDGEAMVHGRARARPEHLDWDRVTMNTVLPNGARLYVDHAHPEYSSPEVLSPFELVRYDAAGDAVAYRAVAEIAKHSGTNLPDISLYKNNTDSKGQSYGAHENYLIARTVPFNEVARALLPFFATRIIYTGSGRVGIGVSGQQPGFQLSSRADFFERTVGLETTIRRPLINTRDEPHAQSEKYRRLHVIPADANLSHYSNLLKFGTAALVLNLIESGKAPAPQLADAVAAFHTISHDLTLSTPLALHPGGHTTALEIQRTYLQACTAHEHTNPHGVDEETGRILQLWEETLTLLETDPLALADRLDWVAKYSLARGYIAKGVSWSDNKLKALDLQYADIDPHRGLYHRLVARGRMRTLYSPEQIARATDTPPDNTRAYLRGTLMKYWPREILSINWDSVCCRGPYSTTATRLMMPEPTGYTRTLIEPLLKHANHAEELLHLLSQQTNPPQ